MKITIPAILTSLCLVGIGVSVSMSSTTNTPTAGVKVQKLQSAETNAPAPQKPPPKPCYIVPRAHLLSTPYGQFVLVPERNWPDLLSMFPSQILTNFTFYTTP